MQQYEQGERFIEAVESAGGRSLLRQGVGGSGVAARLVGDPRLRGHGSPGPELTGDRRRCRPGGRLAGLMADAGGRSDGAR